jgi:hypothetical protein
VDEFNFVTVVDATHDGDAIYPTLSPPDDDFPVDLHEQDGDITYLEANLLRVQQVVRGAMTETFRLPKDIKWEVLITNTRIIFYSTKYDKGGRWGGVGAGAVFALAANAVSMARAAHRRKGTVLVGQIRYQWLSLVGGSPKIGWKSRENLRFKVDANPGGQGHRYLYLTLVLPSHLEATELANEIATRCATYRLQRGEQMTDEQAQAFEEIASAPIREAVSRTPGDPAWAWYEMPTSYRVNTATASHRAPAIGQRDTSEIMPPDARELRHTVDQVRIHDHASGSSRESSMALEDASARTHVPTTVERTETLFFALGPLQGLRHLPTGLLVNVDEIRKALTAADDLARTSELAASQSRLDSLAVGATAAGASLMSAIHVRINDRFVVDHGDPALSLTRIDYTGDAVAIPDLGMYLEEVDGFVLCSGLERTDRSHLTLRADLQVLAGGSPSTREAFEHWLRSVGHRPLVRKPIGLIGDDARAFGFGIGFRAAMGSATVAVLDDRIIGVITEPPDLTFMPPAGDWELLPEVGTFDGITSLVAFSCSRDAIHEMEVVERGLGRAPYASVRGHNYTFALQPSVMLDEGRWRRTQRDLLREALGRLARLV